jgi:uncharacterized protein YukE
MTVHGAAADHLEQLATLFADSSKVLQRASEALSRQLRTSPWEGSGATQFRAEWSRIHRSSLILVAQELAACADGVRRNAREQREASQDFQGMIVASYATCEIPHLGVLTHRSVIRFESHGGGRADIVEALYATADPRRAEGNEIEIRQLDNGKYIVVLPGVVDLSSKVPSIVESRSLDPWYVGEQPDTVRRMAYAIEEAKDNGDTFRNPYALRVIEQMQRAGIPAGADVMLMGHSFGAYTAMELAGDDSFNSADGTFDGYHVNISHVVAAGADTNWKLAELPAQTNALILNNRKDLVFAGEDVLQPDLAPRHAGHVEVEFFGKSDSQAIEGIGHSPDIYVEWLQHARDRSSLNSWLDDAGSMYASGGLAYSVQVPDRRDW